jgi:tetratricopeptide (TPR) repeat protein
MKLPNEQPHLEAAFKVNVLANAFSVSSPELSANIKSLYDKGLCRKAYDLATSAGPLNRFTRVDACIMAGRIALNLGATRLSHCLHIRAHRSDPKEIRAQAYYLETVLGMRGPVFAWQLFKRLEREQQKHIAEEASDEGWEYFFTLGARISGHFRDFELAEKFIKIAEKRKSPFPWLLVERAGLLYMQEKSVEALEISQQALEIQPWDRPAVMQTAFCLHSLNQNDKALHLLSEAAQKLESVAILNQLADLQMNLELYGEALLTLDKTVALSPILDKANQRWIAGQRCRAACILGDYEKARSSALQIDDDYHRELAVRLGQGVKSSHRVQLSIPFIRQYSMTCVPATLTMLCQHWQIPADQVEVAEAICYDGTPTHRARRWAEANGMTTREFTLDWNIAISLLDKKIPFAVFTVETSSAHIQIAMGYDEVRRVFILRDPSFPQVREVTADQFLRRYEANGPGCMVAVPITQANLLEGLTFVDAPMYDHLRQIQQALEDHRRSDAIEELARMQKTNPDHWLYLTANRALYSYDTNWQALSVNLDKLWQRFPRNGNLSLSKLGCLRELGRREDRLEFLQSLSEGKEVDPVFQQQLAEELMVDARQFPKVELILKRALRMQPLNAITIISLANLYWNQHRFDVSMDLYRSAACLDDKREPNANSYFAAANARRQTELGLEFLRKRYERNGAKAAEPFITWFNALQQTGRSRDAMKFLDDALRSHPQHGNLWLTAADAYARHGSFEKADQCLASAEKRVQRTAHLRVKAELARYRGDLKSAIALWREVLQIEPLLVTYHRSFVMILAETEGRAAAMKYLEDFCERFPYHYQMHQLWCEWARGAGPEKAEEITRKLARAHPADAWARRQLALVLADAARYDEALVEAEEGLNLAPQQPVGHTTRAHVRLGLGRILQAQEDFRQSIRLSVDYSSAIHGLVNSCNDVIERKEALGFIEQELIRQVTFGEGLRAFRDAARLSLEPDTLLAAVRLAFKERPDLSTSWSVIVHQLAEMLQLDEALALAIESAEKFPLQEHVWSDLALVYRLKLETKQERDALEQAMRISPASSNAARSLAQHYERSGEIARACELLEEACARAPLDAYSHGSLAAILWQKGDQKAAIARMLHAVKVLPGYNWGWQMLAAWAEATKQPKLAEEQAKIMVLQRPGDLHLILILARLLANSKRMEEALQLVNQAVKDFLYTANLYELRAEILNALGRQDEANKSCEPDVFGKRLPASLRACRARLEAQRGNLVTAIERMKEVLKENPGYSGGWQNLADWLWRQNLHEEAMSAITNVGRLDPLNPMPLGYRASMKLKQEDQAGAKNDLLRALKFDPGYTFAALELFKIQLLEPDIDGAWRTLELIRRYAGGEKAKACEVQLRTRSMQITASQKTVSKADSKQQRTQDLEQTLVHFRELCSTAESDGNNFDSAIRALIDTKETKQVDQILAEMIKNSACNPAVGSWWMLRRIEKGCWFSTHQVNKLCQESKAARQAVITLIEKLGDHKRSIGRTIAIVYLFMILFKLAQKVWRGLALRWLSWRHRAWLRTDNHAWASMGFALTRLKSNSAAIRWMNDWRQRSDLQMWMLFNLALALQERRMWQQLRELLHAAMNLPVKDNTFQAIRSMLALELAMAGETKEAAKHFHEINTSGFTAFMQLKYNFAQSLIAVQQAESAERKKVFFSERIRLRSILARCRVTTGRADYRRCIKQMAHETGSRWQVISAWLGI